MKIAILGTGNVGYALGSGWVRAGHEVIYGSRRPQDPTLQARLSALRDGATAASHQAAVDAAEVVVLATPWSAVQSLLAALSGWDGRVLVDATNPIAPGLQLAVGGDTSAAEMVAGWAPGARVVKAFNTTGYNNMDNPVYDGESTTMFIGGDDADARATVSRLAEDLGFDVADVGSLATARWLEPLALIWISLARQHGREIALKVLHR